MTILRSCFTIHGTYQRDQNSLSSMQHTSLIYFALRWSGYQINVSLAILCRPELEQCATLIHKEVIEYLLLNCEFVCFVSTIGSPNNNLAAISRLIVFYKTTNKLSSTNDTLTAKAVHSKHEDIV